MRTSRLTTWCSLLLVLAYVLASMPAVPTFWSSAATADPAHNPACACVSCSEDDACCCAPPALEPEEEPDGPAWSSVDCAWLAGWFVVKEAPAVMETGLVSDAQPVAVQVCLIPVAPRPGRMLETDEPPPRSL